MKNFFVIALAILHSYCIAQQVGLVKPFLPEIFGQFPNVRDMAITSDKNEIYFTVETYKKEFSAIYFIRKTTSGWSVPEVAPFSGQYRDLEPFLTANGLRLYFASARPLDLKSKTQKDIDIWYVERNDRTSPWGAAINAGNTINSSKDEFYPSVSLSGNIYFTRQADDPKRKEDIYVSELKNDSYTTPVALNDSINGNTYEYNAFVAPDESYIIFTSYGRKGDLGGSDLYISKKNKQGSWLAAEHMGAINSNKIDYCPFVDISTNTLYFTSERSDIPSFFENTQTANDFKKLINVYSNGCGRIYQVNFAPFISK